MLPLHLLDDFSPHARVATAVAPFVCAVLLRLFVGKSSFAGWLISISLVWFVVNIMLAPYSAGMREDLMRVGNLLH